MKNITAEISAWIDRVPKRTLSYFMILVSVVMVAIGCNTVKECRDQLDALKLIQKTYTQAVSSCMPISYRQTQSIGEVYNVAVSGLSETYKKSIDRKIEAIAEAYYDHRENLHRDRNGAFAPNDDPGPGVHVDIGGWKTDIPTPFLPPARTTDGKVINNAKDNPAGCWSGPID